MAGAAPSAFLHDSDPRERDLLRSLPYAPFPPGKEGMDSELRRTWHRVQSVSFLEYEP